MAINRPLYPQIYSSFKGRGDEEYFVQDLTENFFDAAVDFIVANHARGAVFHRAAGTLADDRGIECVNEMYRNVFKQKVSLICLKKETREIAGLNALCVKSRSDIPKVEARVTQNPITTPIKYNFILEVEQQRLAIACSFSKLHRC